MALKIRLSRHGSKKRPYYHIVVADSRMPRDGRYIEKLGSYNPMLGHEDDKRVQFVAERVAHWIKIGAKPTDRVHRFLAQAKLYKTFKPNAQTKRHLPGAKALERIQQAEEEKKSAPKAETQVPAAPPAEQPAAAEDATTPQG